MGGRCIEKKKYSEIPKLDDRLIGEDSTAHFAE